MTKQEFKTRWESNEDGGGITFNDIADCAIAWGITLAPRIMKVDLVRYKVLKAAETNDAEEYKPEKETGNSYCSECNLERENAELRETKEELIRGQLKLQREITLLRALIKRLRRGLTSL